MYTVWEQADYRGKWWIESQDETWSGRFTFTPEQGGSLDLHAGHGEFGWSTPREELPLLFGEAIDGTPITLVDLSQVRTNVHSPGGVEVGFDVRYALIGAWFDSLDDLAFDRLDFQLSGLAEWAGISGFDATGRSAWRARASGSAAAR
jgi:ApeA N-terminal domain 1